MVALLFVIARFSFGYFVGFYLYTLVLGFLWIVNFTKYDYDHAGAAWSAAASMLLFLLPALLIRAPVARSFALSTRNLEHLLRFLMALSLLTIAAASAYNFRFVTLDHIYDFRSELHFPTAIRYLIGIVSNSVLPFTVACYLALNQRWRAGVVLVLMLLFYPITLSKLALFAPAWIAALLVLSKFFEARTTTVLSLLLPVLVGVILIVAVPTAFGSLAYFDKVNIRMIATPSSAIDIYNDFFSKNPHTYFCQLSFLKPLMHCPYQDQLSVVMEKTYGFGNLNASLFATEGVASVGLFFAPLFGVALRARDRLRQPIVGRPAAAFHPDLGRAASAGSPQRALLNRVGHARDGAADVAVVRHAADNIRCERSNKRVRQQCASKRRRVRAPRPERHAQTPRRKLRHARRDPATGRGPPSVGRLAKRRRDDPPGSRNR